MGLIHNKVHVPASGISFDARLISINGISITHQHRRNIASRSYHGQDKPLEEQIDQTNNETSLVSRRSLAITTTLSTLLLPAHPTFAALSSSPTTDTLSSLSSTPLPQSIQRHREAKMVMRVLALRGSVPRNYIEDFSTALEGYGMIAMSTKPTLADIWQELSGESILTETSRKKKNNTKNKKPGKLSTVDAVTLGDTWLQPAIAHDLLQPIENAEQYRYWDALSPRWQNLMRRSPSTGHIDPHGQIYGIPYRWGCTLVLHRTDRPSSQNFTDWDDLLRPSLKNRIAMTDNPRELVGIALKTFGLSFNATIKTIATCGVTENDILLRVRDIVRHARVFSSSQHVRALVAGDVDVLIGWSDDVLQYAKRSNTIDVCVPLSGTALWADVWAVPKHAAGGAYDGTPSPLLPAWLELALQPIRVRRSMGLQGGASPLLLPPPEQQQQLSSSALCTPIKTKLSGTSKLVDGGLPCDEVLGRSEFLHPLDEESEKMYRRILTQLKRVSS